MADLSTVDVVILRGEHKGALLIAKTPRAQLHFELEYQDVYRNAKGEVFVMRNLEATQEIKNDLTALGFTIEEK